MLQWTWKCWYLFYILILFSLHIQLTLEQCRFELHESTYMWMFVTDKYNLQLVESADAEELQMWRNQVYGELTISYMQILRNLHTVFHNGCMNLHPHQPYTKGSLFSHPWQHLLPLFFLIVATLTDVRVFLIVVFSCIFWYWAPFIYLIGYLYISEKMSFQVLWLLWPFLNQSFCGFLFFGGFFLLLRGMSSLCVLDINPSLDIWFANIFSHSIGCLFIWLMISFDDQEYFSLMWSHMLVFIFVAFAFGVKPKTVLPRRMSKSLCLIFSSRSFTVSG